MPHPLSHQQARAFYDRFGSKQDLQRFYEDPAMRALLAHGGFEQARAVVEFGCGTGALAKNLLERRLGAEATYLGLDVSGTMVALARERVAPWEARARILQTDGAPRLPVGDAACDRVVSTYVLDLLSPDDARAVIREARRALAPDGRLCLASLTFGQGPFSRGLCRLWNRLYAIRPQLVGGCRPIGLLDYLADGWRVLHREVVCTFGLCTEVVIAQPAPQ